MPNFNDYALAQIQDQIDEWETYASNLSVVWGQLYDLVEEVCDQGELGFTVLWSVLDEIDHGPQRAKAAFQRAMLEGDFETASFYREDIGRGSCESQRTQDEIAGFAYRALEDFKAGVYTFS